MPNTVISIRSSGVTGNTPSLGVLANGELSLNFADGILYYKTAANALGSIRTTQPSGLNQEIQFNDSGSFGSNSGLTFNKSTGYFKAPIIESTNNGNGTNFKVGDDIWIGDINLADTLRLTGQQNVNNAYIVFGASDSSKLGRSGTGALTYSGSFVATGELSSLNSSGDEGGQLNFALAQTNTTLSGGVVVDIYQNKLRFYESGGTNRGVYIDIANGASSSVATDLLNPSATPDTVARATANAAYNHANGAFDKANTDVTNISATAGVYGNATYVPVITLAANGRVSSITNTAISGISGGNSFGVIYTSNNSTYANATSSTDQLNFVGEAGVIAFANSLTKTITIAGTPGAQGLTVDYGYVYEAMNYSIDYGTL